MRTLPYPRATKKQKTLYDALQNINQELAEVNQKINKLKEEKGNLQEQLARSFGKHSRRRLDADHVVVCNQVVVEDKIVQPSDVGKVMRKGYQYWQFKTEEI